jgi:hypothetical protein
MLNADLPGEANTSVAEDCTLTDSLLYCAK